MLVITVFDLKRVNSYSLLVRVDESTSCRILAGSTNLGTLPGSMDLNPGRGNSNVVLGRKSQLMTYVFSLGRQQDPLLEPPVNSTCSYYSTLWQALDTTYPLRIHKADTESRHPSNC